MKTISAIVFLLILHLTMQAQIENVSDSLNATSDHRKLNGFLSLITDFTINEQHQFASTGMGAAFLIANKYYIGGYGLGLISSIHKSDILVDNAIPDYQLNYAHGGLWLGIIDSPCKKINNSFSVKIGWGALFLYNINSPIVYNIYRDEFLVVTPQIETDILITNWLRINMGIGVRFLYGISTKYQNSNGDLQNIYKSSDFEGFITSVTFNFGSFCNESPH